MKLRIPLQIATVAVAMAALPAAAQATKIDARCAQHAGATKLSTKSARVFAYRGRLYSCLRKHQAYLVGRSTKNSVWALVGNYDAEVRYGSGDSAKQAYVGVRDLRTGRLINGNPSLGGYNAALRDPVGSVVQDVVLQKTGTVAWIAAYGGHAPATYDVYTSDATGVSRLDSGTTVVPHSLAVSRNGTVYWSNGRELRSTGLGG